MSSLKIHVGDTLEDIGARVLAAVRRAEAGEYVSEEHLTSTVSKLWRVC